MFHLVNRLVDIGQRLVLAVLFYPLRHFRFPAFGQLLERAHVEITVMKIIFELSLKNYCGYTGWIICTPCTNWR